ASPTPVIPSSVMILRVTKLRPGQVTMTLASTIFTAETDPFCGVVHRLGEPAGRVAYDGVRFVTLRRSAAGAQWDLAGAPRACREPATRRCRAEDRRRQFG